MSRLSEAVLNASEFCLTSLLECAPNYSQVLKLDTGDVSVQLEAFPDPGPHCDSVVNAVVSTEI